MEKLLILREIRLKQNRTKAEEMLLEYREKLSTICEILVSESKCHISPEKALNDIRKII